MSDIFNSYNALRLHMGVPDLNEDAPKSSPFLHAAQRGLDEYRKDTVCAQRMNFLPWKTFRRIVTRYDGDYRIRALPCSEHFRILAFAQLTYRESLRDIEACLSAQAAKLYPRGQKTHATSW